MGLSNSIREHRFKYGEMTQKELAGQVGVSRQTIWRWHREDPDFPRAISLSPGCTRWALAAIEAWEIAKASKPRATAAA